MGNDSPERMSDAEAREMTNALLTASHLLVAVTARSLNSIEEEITIRQLRALIVISVFGHPNVSEFARRLDIAPSTAMRMMERLEEKGWAVRGVSETDRRADVIMLTRRGAAIVDTVTTKRIHEIAEIV